jgi:hypothetical protein
MFISIIVIYTQGASETAFTVNPMKFPKLLLAKLIKILLTLPLSRILRLQRIVRVTVKNLMISESLKIYGSCDSSSSWAEIRKRSRKVK